jgi:hypothetical protein
MLALWFVVTLAPSVHAQRIPVEPGYTVRIAPAEASDPPAWRVGTVLDVTRQRALLRSADPLTDTVAVPFNGSVRVQVRSRSNHTTLLGAGLGAGLGGALGATVLSSAFDRAWANSRGVVAEVAGFGFLGLLLGAGIGFFTQPVGWAEIPIPSGGWRIAPLSRPAEPAGFGTTERWCEFEPTAADFGAFFWTWRDSLHAVEGVWELDPLLTTEAPPAATWAGGLPRMAIVRDLRYPGYDYIAIMMPPENASRPFREYSVAGPRNSRCGRVLFAMRPLDEPGFFEVRYAHGGTRSQVAEFWEDWLEFRLPGNPAVRVWDKLVLTER